MSYSPRQWIGLAAAVFLLHTAFSFHNVWPTLGIEVRPELSVEAAALVLILALYRRLVGEPSRRFLAVLAGLVFLMTLGRYMEVTAPALYGRAVNLYWDARYLPDVAAMFASSASLMQMVAVVTAIVVATVLLYYALYRALAVIGDSLAVPPVSTALKSVAGFLVVAYLLGYYTSVPTLRWFSIPVSQTYTRQAQNVIDALTGPDAIATLPTEEPLAAIDATSLPDRDVVVTFMESYGATAYDDPYLATVLAEPRRQFAAAIEQSGRSMVSAFVVAPTFGGGSWLSHISFMSGIDIDDAARYDALLTQSRLTLPKLFSTAGFRTLALMPGLKNEWPEGAFYGFDDIIGAERLAYAGPEFGWWRIPDQFSLARLDATELAATNRAPAFVFFPTISTHAPFRPTAPYQRDWQRMLSAAPFDSADLGMIDAPTPSLSELQPAYGDALAYTYAYWGGYLNAVRERDFLLVLVGDHQPQASVSGQGVRWDVPVHVISRDDALLARLVERGFRPGVTPAPMPIARMHELGLLLLN